MKKRKDGRYASQVFVGWKDKLGKDGAPVLDESGEPVKVRHYISVYGATQKEVRMKAEELRIKKGKGIDVVSANDAFSIWADRYLESKAKEGVSFSCMQGAKTWRNHLSALDDIPISKVTAAQVQAIVDRLADYHEGKPPMSKRTLTGVKQTAWRVFNEAAALRVIEYNPAEYVTIPKNAAERHRNAISEEQQRWIRETPHVMQIGAMIMLYAGLRRGELLALTWNDIDFSDGVIHVSKAVEYANGRPSIKKTKTAAGMRTVKMPQVLSDYLAAARKRINTLQVIPGRKGTLIKQTAWRTSWTGYMQYLNIVHGYSSEETKDVESPAELEMKIETFTPHQLRHTYVTLLYLAGVDVMTARDQAGHTDIKTTLGIYTHLDKKYKRDSMSKLDEYLCRSDTGQEEDGIIELAK